jgi:ribonuclease BN (tRNA processing enzyme)
MTSANASVPSSSRNLAKLRIDFYESGIGDTIIVTFPSGGIGLVDAHPSQHGHRPDIRQLVAGRKLHFVCLTHPHADHGVDLIPVLERHPQIEEFWHTIHDIPALVYGVEQTVNFPSSVREHASKMNQDWGEFLFDLLAAVGERKIPRHLLRSDLRERFIDGVDVHCLGPDESVQNLFFDAYKKKLANPEVEVPDPNSISAILALKFGQSLVLLGADALRKNWESAVKQHRKLDLPKARVLKVPHHGARNSFNLQRDAVNYLDICSYTPKAKAVLFAGDAKHPDRDVYARLRERTEVMCLSNGTRAPLADSNPLRLQIPGARATRSAPVCNPVVSIEVDADGNVAILAGVGCDGCTRNNNDDH